MRSARIVVALMLAAPAHAQEKPPAPHPPAATVHPLDSLVRTRIRVDSSPDWMAPVFGSLWTTTYRPGALHRIDLATNRVAQSVAIGRNPCLGIGVIGGELWVPACEDDVVVAIDHRTLRETHRVALPLHHGREGFIAAGFGSVWVPVRRDAGDSLSRGLARIDARTAKVGATIAVNAGSTTVTTGFGSVWVAESDVDSVARIDPRTNAVVARVKVGGSPKFMAVGFGSVWVQNRKDGSISRIDPSTNREIARVETGSPTRAGDLATGGGAVWYTVSGAPVIRIDPATNRVTHAFVGGDKADAIRVGLGAVWVASYGHDEVWRIPLARFDR